MRIAHCIQGDKSVIINFILYIILLPVMDALFSNFYIENLKCMFYARKNKRADVDNITSIVTDTTEDCW